MSTVVSVFERVLGEHIDHPFLLVVHFNADTDDIMEPVKEGFMTAFSAFMVSSGLSEMRFF